MASYQSIELGIEGMTCASCSARVERALKKLPGMLDAGVNLATERASIRFDGQAIGLAGIVEAVREVGYTPLTAEMEIGVGGMTCANCSARVERALKKLPGVIEAGVNLATERATLRYLPASLGPDEVARTIEEAGYEPRLLDEEAGEDRDAERSEERRVGKEGRSRWSPYH